MTIEYRWVLASGSAVLFTAYEELREKIAQSVNLSTGKTNEIKVGEVCYFIGSEQQSIPYRWRYKISKGKLLNVCYDEIEYSGSASAPGSDKANRIIYFEAVAKGTCSIILKYGRYGAKWNDDDVNEEYTFNIVISD